MYRILLVDGESLHWRDCQEGPWNTADAAIDFADAEVGMPWVVVDDNCQPIAFGDCFGLHS